MKKKDEKICLLNVKTNYKVAINMTMHIDKRMKRLNKILQNKSSDTSSHISGPLNVLCNVVAV